MKQNKKGFTLIELLAVIVILAIIALIATPIVLNMINQARKSAARSSSLGFIDSIEYYAGFNQAQDDSIQLGYDNAVPQVTPAGNITCEYNGSAWSLEEGLTPDATVKNGDDTAATCATFFAGVTSKSKGKAPSEAKIIMNTAGKVQASSTLKYNTFTCTYDGSDVSCK